ncbi:MAG: biotin/lipoyl-binding protein, partial [Cyanobacteriota bacterium]|nr:biotin/lipoyl-binding protein [Cyanobacteriota bacterium]
MTSNSLSPETPVDQVRDSSQLWKQFSHKRSRLPIILATTGGLLLAGIPLIPFVSNRFDTPVVDSNPVRALPVETLTVQPVESYQVSRSYTGEIAAMRASDLGFERGGKLVQVWVEEGDRVETGDIIARLDREELEAQLDQAEATLDRTRANLAELEAGSRSEDIAAARARLNRAQANLDELEAGNRVEDIAIAQAELNEAEAQLADARAGSLQDEIAQAEASLRANQADFQLAIARVKRYQVLREEGAISQDDFDQYRQDERRLEALVDEARRRIQQLEKSQQSQVQQLAAIAEQRRQNLRKLKNGPRL